MQRPGRSVAAVVAGLGWGGRTAALEAVETVGKRIATTIEAATADHHEAAIPARIRQIEPKPPFC